jgi:hypothetical protein
MRAGEEREIHALARERGDRTSGADLSRRVGAGQVEGMTVAALLRPSRQMIYGGPLRFASGGEEGTR